jgi:hypothetical protein
VWVVVDDVLALGRDAEVRLVALYHHEPERDDALDRIGLAAGSWAWTYARGMQTIVAREGLTLDVVPD